MNRNAWIGLIGLGVLAGCKSPPAPVAFIPAPPAAPPTPTPSATADGVYRMPKIGKVFLRAHVDANGRLVGPQVVYQIVEPGRWNLEALEPADPEPAKVAAPRFEADAGWLISDGAPAPAGGTAPAAAVTESSGPR